MNCPNCGANINQNESFCGSCGTKLSNQIQENKYINNNESSEKRKMNKNAIYSIICSVICLFIFWWLSFAGISLGVQALKQIKETKEKGKILAYIGIILGGISIVLYFSGSILN